MAFQNSLSGRMEELRFPALRSPEHDTFPPNGPATARPESGFFGAQGSGDARISLQRRFTTDASKMSLARPFGGAQFGGMPQTSTKQKLMDDIHSAKRMAEEQLRLLELQERRLNGDEGMDTITNRLNRASLHGPVSEPTTPPEYNDNSYASRFSRGSRLSTSSIMSPPGLSKRYSQTSTHMMSPSTARMSGSMFNQPQPSAKSMPASRRGSDEEEDYAEDLPNIRQPAIGNRYSMPVGTSRPIQSHRFSVGQVSSRGAFDLPINTSFLDDSENQSGANGLDLKSPISKTFAALEGDDTFPTLISDGLKLSANSAALDLANSKTPDGIAQLEGADWSIGSRIRPSHQSMPHNDSSMYRPVLSNITPPNTDRPGEPVRRKSQRHSMGVTFEEGPKYDNTPLPASRPASLQTSYSTNDVPTVRKSLTMESATTPSKTVAEQQFLHHNMALGRIPPTNGARQSRDFGNGQYKMDEKNSSPQAAQNGSVPFGSGYENMMIGLPSANPTYGAQSTYSTSNMAVNGYGNGVNVQAYSSTVNGQGYGYNNNNGTYGNNYAKNPEVATRGGGGGRRNNNNNDENRFNNAPLESYRGRLYELCKDQHGCRFLQRKLEDGDADQIAFIFTETFPYIVELMTDPFGNYLCQKLFEHCNEDQRNVLIRTSAPCLASIAENQHGTRALQKMIEFLHTSEQVTMITEALEPYVVKLVQDLNGNHVIQKCLTRLGPEQSQFIYDSVAKWCVVVGTHRHGCCVLQRCIDHSQGTQRANLIGQIISCAFDLVQDPFGNYVVQYILDLDEPVFTKALCECFHGRIVALSKQKFSSNVIEKCLRTAGMDTKRVLVDEMVSGGELDRMLRDSFANYVVQTALDYVDEETRGRLSDAIRPLLPAIKSTPHGRRIASKIMNADQARNQVQTPSQAPVGAPSTESYGMSTGRASGRRQIQIVGGGFNGPRASAGPYNYSGQGADQNMANSMTHGMANGMSSMSNGVQGGMPNNMSNGMSHGMPNGNGNTFMGGAPANNAGGDMYAAPPGYGYPSNQSGNGYPNNQSGNGYPNNQSGNGYPNNQSGNGYPNNQSGNGYPNNQSGNGYPNNQPGNGFI